MKRVKLDSLYQFISQHKIDGWDDSAIVYQLCLYSQGIRDYRLHDSCITLLDGEVSDDSESA